MADDDLHRRVAALEKAAAESQALINRGKGMLWLIVALGMVATFVFSIAAGVRSFLGGAP